METMVVPINIREVMKMSSSNEIMKNDDVSCCEFYLIHKREENTGKIDVEWNLALIKFLTNMDDVTDRHVFEFSFQYFCEDFSEYENSVLNKYCNFEEYFKLKEDIILYVKEQARRNVFKNNYESCNKSDIIQYRDFLKKIVESSLNELDFDYLYLEFKDRWNNWKKNKFKYNKFNEYSLSLPEGDWLDFTEILESNYSIRDLVSIKEEEYLNNLFGLDSSQYNDSE